MDVGGLVMQVVPMADSDAEELADLAGQLHAASRPREAGAEDQGR
jgi:hypothetical protein